MQGGRGTAWVPGPAVDREVLPGLCLPDIQFRVGLEFSRGSLPSVNMHHPAPTSPIGTIGHNQGRYVSWSPTSRHQWGRPTQQALAVARGPRSSMALSGLGTTLRTLH